MASSLPAAVRSGVKLPLGAGPRWRIGLVSLALLVLPGCPDSKPRLDKQGPGALFAGVRLQVALPAGLDLRDAWQLAITEWQASTGAQCAVDEVDMSAAGALLELVPPGTSLLVAPWPRAPELASAGWPAAIPEAEGGLDALAWRDVFTGLRNGLATPGGRPALLPLSCPVLVCYYRADLLEAAGLHAPATWAEYQRLLDALDRWAPGLSAVEPWSAEFRATMFLARAAPYALHPENFSLYLDVERATPLIGDEPFVRALTDALAALPMLGAASLNFGPAECRRAILEGRAALAIALEPPDADRTATIPIRRADVRIGVCPLPGANEVYDRSRGRWTDSAGPEANRVTLAAFAGYAVCVSRRASVKEQLAAWDLWAAINAQAEAGVVRDDRVRSLCRRSQLAASPQVDSLLLPEERKLYARAVTKALDTTRVVAELPLPKRARFREALTQGLTLVIESQTSPADALRETANAWEAILEEVGRRIVVDAYRTGIGLSPLPPEN